MAGPHTEANPAGGTHQSGDYIEVWEDRVSIKSLALSLLVCSCTTLVAYFIAPNEPPKPLFFGLIGALIGFGVCCFLIKPKRVFRVVEDGE